MANVVIPKELKSLRQARSQADATWRGIQDAWIKQPGNRQFLQTKAELNELIRSLTDLPNEERRQLQILEQKKREAQLHRYLERFLIANAKIKKIGSGRKAVLASFGVQTAADVDRHKIAAIQGFGPALIGELMTWRQGVANKFVFNASEPVNQNDLFALKARVANRKKELDNKIRASTATLQQTSVGSLNHRGRLTNLANQAFAARKQAEVNEQAATGPLHKASKFISFCCAGLAAIGLMKGESLLNPISPPNKPVIETRVPNAPITLPADKSVQSTMEGQPRVAVAPPIDLNTLPSSPANNAPRPQAPAVAPPLPAQEIPGIPIAPPEIPTNNVAQRQITEIPGATQVQQRLVELGYLSAVANGKWGPMSKRALVEFKQQAGLDKNDTWDGETEHALFSNSAPHAMSTLLFVGGWSPEQGQCGEVGEPPPLRVTPDKAESDGGVCVFNSVQPDGNGAWRIVANCSAGGNSHIAHIRLSVNGSVLQWTSEEPETLYYRCVGRR